MEKPVSAHRADLQPRQADHFHTYGDVLDDTLLLQSSDIFAMLSAAYQGQDGGSAVFNLLTGAIAPASILPVIQYPTVCRQ